MLIVEMPEESPGEAMKTEAIGGIWTASTMTQALSILNNVRGL